MTWNIHISGWGHLSCLPFLTPFLPRTFFWVTFCLDHDEQKQSALVLASLWVQVKLSKKMKMACDVTLHVITIHTQYKAGKISVVGKIKIGGMIPQPRDCCLMLYQTSYHDAMFQPRTMHFAESGRTPIEWMAVLVTPSVTCFLSHLPKRVGKAHGTWSAWWKVLLKLGDM